MRAATCLTPRAAPTFAVPSALEVGATAGHTSAVVRARGDFDIAQLTLFPYRWERDLLSMGCASARQLPPRPRVDPGPIGRRTLWDRGASIPFLQARCDRPASACYSASAALGWCCGWYGRWPAYFRTVLRSIPTARATAKGVAPSAKRCVISDRWPSSSWGRPILAPRRHARSRPALVRSDIFCASIFASELRTASRAFRTSSLSVLRCASVYEWNFTP